MDTNTNSSQGYARGQEVSAAAALIDQARVPDEPEKKKPAPVEELAETQEPAGQDAGAVTDESQPGGDAERVTDQVDPETASGDADAEVKPVTLKELAENLEIDAADLYDVEIAIGKDESVTLGALKDSFKEFKSLKANEEQNAQRRLTEENEHLAAKRQIDNIIEVAFKTGVLSPELQETLQTYNAEKVTKERRYALAAIPEWSDEVQRTADFDSMVEHMKEYGFSEGEIRGEIDHRKLKFMRDVVKRDQLAKKFHKETVTPKQIRGGANQAAAKSTSLRAKIDAAKTSRNHALKVSTVSELINS